MAPEGKLRLSEESHLPRAIHQHLRESEFPDTGILEA